ncbi:MAG: hypothetical protein K2X55_13180 [Burkholderiaceae bacterium]|nr:hypothetical protein [Burkholderiaceae bacterium]
MTIISGVRVMCSPCCGKYFSFPNYRSMNFSAFEYWTDGWSDGVLMPVGEGVRTCTCGSLFLTRQCELIEVAESANFPSPGWARTEDFRKHIARDLEQDLMLAIRLDLWRDLNHPYREEYRTHRENEENEIRMEWVEANPDRRNWWDKLRGKKAPIYHRPIDRSITFPRFQPSVEQLDNMKELTELLMQRTLGDGDSLLLAELLREQGRFEEARRTIDLVKSEYDPIRKTVISLRLERRESMPVRFRY